MPKIIIPREDGAGSRLSSNPDVGVWTSPNQLSIGYDGMDLARTIMITLNKRGVDSRLGLEDPENLIIFTGEDV